MFWKRHLACSVENILLWVEFILAVCVLSADLCSSFLDHFQLTLVDLDAPEETVEEPQEDPTCQPEQQEECEKMWNMITEPKTWAVAEFRLF